MNSNDPVAPPEELDTTRPQGDTAPPDVLEPFQPGEEPEIPELADYDPGLAEGVKLWMMYTPGGKAMPQSIVSGSPAHPHHWRTHASATYMAAGVHPPPMEELLKPIDQGGQGWTVRRIVIHGHEIVTAQEVGEYYVQIKKADLEAKDEPLPDEPEAHNPDVPIGPSEVPRFDDGEGSPFRHDGGGPTI